MIPRMRAISTGGSPHARSTQACCFTVRFTWQARKCPIEWTLAKWTSGFAGISLAASGRLRRHFPGCRSSPRGVGPTNRATTPARGFFRLARRPLPRWPFVDNRFSMQRASLAARPRVTAWQQAAPPRRELRDVDVDRPIDRFLRLLSATHECLQLVDRRCGRLHPLGSPSPSRNQVYLGTAFTMGSEHGFRRCFDGRSRGGF